jgi:cytochrome c biogenesis protein
VAVQRYARLATGTDRPELTRQLAESASRALGLFAGAEAAPAAKGKPPVAGLQAISDFMEANVPEAERNRAGDVLIRILNGTLFELTALTREQAGLKPLPQDGKTQAFMAQMVLTLSDAPHYPAPMAFALKDFKQVQASVFQVARAPGQKLVYLGAVLLIIGVFSMLYIKERRLWLWLEPAPGRNEHTRVRMALSSTRESPDTAVEFEQLKLALLKEEKSV